MGKVIIGIHGLANKPPRTTLQDWWQRALIEGLKNIGVQNPQFDFRIVYWADLLYKRTLHTDKYFSFDVLYNREPYIPAKKGDLQEYRDSWRDMVRARLLDTGGDIIDAYRQRFGSDSVTQWLLGKVLKDLAFYYDPTRQIKNRAGQPESARKVLDDELSTALVAEKGNQIMLIAHSMGSIITYNVLRDLGRSGAGITIDRLVTIGSPLGLPYVKGKIKQERSYDPRVRTPTIVTGSWKNFADRRDPVALDAQLHDDYEANQRGVRIEDDLIRNDYHIIDEEGVVKNNYHKSYGYLRTPEMSRHVADFLR
jgi:hypothetical protein